MGSIRINPLRLINETCDLRFMRHPSRPNPPRPVAKRGSAAGVGVIAGPTEKSTVTVSPTLPPAPSQLMKRLLPDTKAVIGLQGTQSGLLAITSTTEPNALPDKTVKTGPLKGSLE